MDRRSAQAPAAVVMIRPHHFALNEQTAAQIAAVEKSATVVALNVPTIELAGGSVRCMLAGIHLTAR